MDLDDLLGGGPAPQFDDSLLGDGPVGGAASAAAGGDLDDLLGGGPVGMASGLDDLLGFGDAPVAAPVAYGGGGDSLPRSAQKKLTIVPEQPRTEQLQQFVSALDVPVYLSRFISILPADEPRKPQANQRRKRVCFIATNKELMFMSSPTQTERSIPVPNILGLILSVTEAPRRVGSGGQEVHVLMHARGVPDMYMVLGREEGNPDADASVLGVSQQFVAILTTLCASFDCTLPVSTLKRECETLETFYSPVIFADDDLRSKFHTALATRTMQLSELSLLERDERMLDIAISTLKSSEKGASVSSVQADIGQQRGIIKRLQDQEAGAREQLAKVTAELSALKQQLLDEEKRRNAVINQQSASVARDQLLKYNDEYNLLKRNHKREVNRLLNVTAFIERYGRETTAQAYDARNVALRVDDLTEMLHAVQGYASGRTELNSKVVKALTENRRRAAHVKELIKQHSDHLEFIENADSVDSLPVAVADCDVPENIDPIVVDLSATHEQGGSAPQAANARTDVQAIAAVVSQPAAAAPAAAAINLDSDDDI